VAVRYRIVDFLDPASASGDYSTRAYAALISVATHDGDRPGVFTQFRSALFQHQPVENGPSDLSDSDLAALAAGAGASAEAQRAIAGGAALDAATADARSNMASLTAVAASVGRAPGTPTVTVGGTPVATNEAGWLANLLTERDGEAAETQTDAGR
jgi:protein-disulfide isomerase